MKVAKANVMFMIFLDEIIKESAKKNKSFADNIVIIAKNQKKSIT